MVNSHNGIHGLEEDDALDVQFLGQLGAMLKWQDQLSARCGAYGFPPQLQLEMAISQLVVEAGEALAPFLVKTKPWKPQQPNLQHTDLEIIDVLHYVLTYFNVRGLAASEVTALYRQKNLVNFRRIEALLPTEPEGI